MGDVSIIARRLSPKYVQYGWAGNGGYFKSIGIKLLEWYNTKDDDLIDYLFDLGQLRNLGKPGSEKGGCNWFITHELANKSHYVGTSERYIFSKIAFVDYGYFYDSDKEWYYIIPGSFRIKIPLEVIGNNLNDEGYEFSFLRKIKKFIIVYIFEDYIQTDSLFYQLMKDQHLDPNDVKNKLLSSQFPIEYLFDKYRYIFQYFDDWILITATDDKQSIEDVYLQPKRSVHKETIEWLKDEKTYEPVKK